MFRFAHFYTFPFNLIIDPKSLNKPLLFDFNNIKFRLKPPYKCYPYNHDFSFKPLFYINQNGKKEKLPSALGFGSYPMYNNENKHIGMLMQQNNVYSFENSSKLTLDDKAVVPQSFGYRPVDTIRFDTNHKFNQDSPKFLSDFFSHLRILTQQFWINKPRTDNEGVNLEASIKADSNLNNFQFHSNLIPIIRYNKGIPVTYEIWQKAIENTINEIEIDFSKSLYLDAVYERTINNTRSAVLSLANSIDISVNMLFDKINTKKPHFDRHEFVVNNRKNKKVSSTYIPGLVSEFLDSLIDKNYQTENPQNYNIIKDFWLNKRNPVAHGREGNITDQEINLIFDAVYDLLNWLEAIEE